MRVLLLVFDFVSRWCERASSSKRSKEAGASYHTSNCYGSQFPLLLSLTPPTPPCSAPARVAAHGGGASRGLRARLGGDSPRERDRPGPAQRQRLRRAGLPWHRRRATAGGVAVGRSTRPSKLRRAREQGGGHQGAAPEHRQEGATSDTPVVLCGATTLPPCPCPSPVPSRRATTLHPYP